MIEAIFGGIAVLLFLLWIFITVVPVIKEKIQENQRKISEVTNKLFLMILILYSIIILLFLIVGPVLFCICIAMLIITNLNKLYISVPIALISGFLLLRKIKEIKEINELRKKGINIESSIFPQSHSREDLKKIDYIEEKPKVKRQRGNKGKEATTETWKNNHKFLMETLTLKEDRKYFAQALDMGMWGFPGINVSQELVNFSENYGSKDKNYFPKIKTYLVWCNRNDEQISRDSYGRFILSKKVTGIKSSSIASYDRHIDKFLQFKGI